jgi:hypothetical protein
MKKAIFILIAVCGVMYFSGNANAVVPMVETVQGTATVQGVSVSTSVATRVDTIWVNGFNRSWIRIQNQDASANVYCGFDSDVVAVAGLKVGEKLAPLGSLVYNVGRDVKVYCKADGAASVWVSVSQYGY